MEKRAMTEYRDFTEMFIEATKIQEGPYPYQIKWGTDPELPSLVSVPTGLCDEILPSAFSVAEYPAVRQRFPGCDEGAASGITDSYGLFIFKTEATKVSAIWLL
jgi:hypothetical protein